MSGCHSQYKRLRLSVDFCPPVTQPNPTQTTRVSSSAKMSPSVSAAVLLVFFAIFTSASPTNAACSGLDYESGKAEYVLALATDTHYGTVRLFSNPMRSPWTECSPHLSLPVLVCAGYLVQCWSRSMRCGEHRRRFHRCFGSARLGWWIALWPGMTYSILSGIRPSSLTSSPYQSHRNFKSPTRVMAGSRPPPSVTCAPDAPPATLVSLILHYSLHRFSPPPSLA